MLCYMLNLIINIFCEHDRRFATSRMFLQIKSFVHYSDSVKDFSDVQIFCCFYLIYMLIYSINLQLFNGLQFAFVCVLDITSKFHTITTLVNGD
jgi:hypothetical protein